MDNWILIILACCGVLVSMGMITCMILAISVLLKINKISKLFVRIMGVINFEAKLLTPLLMGKRIFDTFFKRKQCTQEERDFIEEEENAPRFLPSVAKWTVIGLAIWKVCRRRIGR